MDEDKEHIKEDIKDGKPTYIMVPKKFVIAWFTSFVIMFLMTAASLQWASYIDRRSNQRWCGIVKLSDRASQQNPNPTPIEQEGAIELQKIQKDFDCK